MDESILFRAAGKLEFQFKSVSFHQMWPGGEDFTPAGVGKILLPIGRSGFVCSALRMRSGENFCARTILDFPSIYKPYYFDNKSIPFTYEFSIPDSFYTETKGYTGGLLREAGFSETEKAPLTVQIIYSYYPIESMLIHGISKAGPPGSLFSNLLSGFTEFEGVKSESFLTSAYRISPEG